MEKEIFLFFHKTLSNNFLDFLMVFFTKRGWIFWLPVFLYMIFKYLKTKDYKFIAYFTLTITLGVFISDWFSLEIKNLIQRIRPCWTEDFRGVVGCTHSYSFPSNHATNALSFSTILILFLKNKFINIRLKKTLYFYILLIALIICISKLYLGVHWLTDVLGGAVLGIMFGFFVFYITTQINSFKKVFYFSLFIISLFRIYFILHAPIDLSPDEAHYWEWSRRLDLSYYSKGPMIAYLIAFSTWIFGDNPFGVRILAVVCSLLSSIFIYRIGTKIFNEKVGYMSGVLFQLIPLFSIFGVIFTIDSPFILFWIISMYLFLMAIEGKKSYWLLLGVSIGLGLLTKYTMAFFYICMIFYLLKKEDNSSALIQNIRKIFKNPWLYACLIISLVVFSPVIVWNFQHNWVTLKHTAGQAHVYDGFKISLRYLAEFFGSQLAVVTPLVFILGLYFFLKPTILNLQSSKRWFLIAFSASVFIFFLLKSIHGKVQANWAMPAYIPFLIVLAYALIQRIYKKLIISAILIAFIFTFISYALPYLNLPEKIDPSARLKGWKELGEKVSEIKKELEKSGKVVIFSDRYQISSELAFYTKEKPTVYCINLGRRMNQYDLWQSINSELNGKTVHGIYVVYGIKNEPELDVSSAFDRCTSENFTAFKKGVKIRDYTIFKCYNFKGMNLRKPKTY